MEITINLDTQVWKDFQSHLEKSLLANNKSWFDSFWVNLISWFAFVTVFLIFFQGTREFSWPTAGIVLLFFMFIYAQLILNALKMKRAFEPLPNGPFCGNHKIKIDDNGIYSEGIGYCTEHKWSLVQRVERTDTAIYIFIDSAMAFIFPLSQLENADDFFEYVSDKSKM